MKNDIALKSLSRSELSNLGVRSLKELARKNKVEIVGPVEKHFLVQALWRHSVAQSNPEIIDQKEKGTYCSASTAQLEEKLNTCSASKDPVVNLLKETQCLLLKSLTPKYCQQYRFNEILPGLFLGGVMANCPSVIKTCRLTGVVSLLDYDVDEVQEKVEGKVRYLRISAEDDPQKDLSQYFKRTFEFIEQELISGGAVLVHCRAGVSRSATIVIAYVMRKYSFSFSNADRVVSTRRPSVCPNRGFLKQLSDFESKLKIKPCV